VRQEFSVRRARGLPPLEDLVNVFEYEETAKLKLPPDVLATIAGSDRAAFDRMTFRPRVNVPTLDMDLSVDLFGEKHFTPIIAGPVADQRRYHPDAELATVRGASAARAGVVVSSRSSAPIGDIGREAKTPLWFSVYADGGPAAQKHVEQAVAAGCRVLFISVGVSSSGARATSERIDWKAIDQIRRGVKVPVVIKGIMTADAAKSAVQQGVQGIVVSDHGGVARGSVAPIEALPVIVDTIGGKATVLVDGSFRRNADIVKALIFGAQGVLIARPVMWALAAYGAAGVQALIEMLQSDLARNMGALGASTVKSLNRNMVRIHRR
jgi:4-hydroxymandelate oxidase